MVLSNEEKERKLEWLHAQLRKYQQRKYEPPAVHASNWSRGPPLPDTETLKDLKARIKESTWEIWEGVEGAYTTQDKVYDEMAARQGVVLDERTRAVWHCTVVRKWKVRIKGKRGKQCGKKGQRVILRIAKGRQYGVISNGNKLHTLAQCRQGTLDPRAIF